MKSGILSGTMTVTATSALALMLAFAPVGPAAYAQAVEQDEVSNSNQTATAVEVQDVQQAFHVVGRYFTLFEQFVFGGHLVLPHRCSHNRSLRPITSYKPSLPHHG